MLVMLLKIGDKSCTTQSYLKTLWEEEKMLRIYFILFQGQNVIRSTLAISKFVICKSVCLQKNCNLGHNF